jgi:molybdopterin converting factor small subunit
VTELSKTRIQVNYLGHVRPLTRKFAETVDLDDHTISGLLKELSKRYGLKFKETVMNGTFNRVKPSILISRNDRIVTDLREKVEKGDRIVISTVAAGG